jgi:hypothetical protein
MMLNGMELNGMLQWALGIAPVEGLSRTALLSDKRNGELSVAQESADIMHDIRPTTYHA